MKSAKEAFELTVANLAEVETIDQQLEIDRKIDEMIERKQFALIAGPYPTHVAEKLALDYEEQGYYANVGNPQMQNGEVVVNLLLNWKTKPSPMSRVDSSLAEK